MDPKRLFFTLVFGLLGGYWVWTGFRALRRPPAAGRPSGARGSEKRRATGTLVVGLLIWLALFLMYGPARSAP